MKPIPFNTERVRAIIDGRKTVTRRLVRPQPRMLYHDGKLYSEDNCLFLLAENHDGGLEQIVSSYRIGDILYVQEAWAFDTGDDGDEIGTGDFFYRADNFHHPDCKWHPSIHMPKEAARLFLRVTNVRVERLQDITAQGAFDEGTVHKPHFMRYGGEKCLVLHGRYKQDFSEIWDRTVKPADRDRYGWAANPWVWVIEFERISKEAALKGGAE